MSEFWSSQSVQYFTILISFAPLLLALRAWKKYEVTRGLSGERLRTFRKLCFETIAQYLLAFGVPILLAVIQTVAGNQDMSSNLANAYLTAAALAGAASLWNIYKAWRDTRHASKQPSNKARTAKLGDVKQKNLSSFTPALSSIVIGTIGLIAYNLNTSPPSWSWFAAFLLTGYAAYGVVWSHSVATVAAEYESDPKLGRKTLR